MSESGRSFGSPVLGVLLMLGGIITLASGAGYMDNDNVSEYVAAIVVVAGFVLMLGGVGCFVKGQLAWNLCLASLILEAIAGLAMMTVSILSGILIVLISMAFFRLIHGPVVTRWFSF